MPPRFYHIFYQTVFQFATSSIIPHLLFPSLWLLSSVMDVLKFSSSTFQSFNSKCESNLSHLGFFLIYFNFCFVVLSVHFEQLLPLSPPTNSSSPAVYTLARAIDGKDENAAWYSAGRLGILVELMIRVENCRS